MMPPSKLVRVVTANALRTPRHLTLSVFGIVIGIAAFVFFLGLSTGVRAVILGDIFPIEQVEVVAPAARIAGTNWRANALTDEVVGKLRERPEVASVVPRMTVKFPASGRGWFEGQDIKFEVGGFCDGIDPSFVDPGYADLFRDWETVEDAAERKPCGPAPDYTCPNDDTHYCDQRDRKCHHRVPVIVSRTLLEIYNGQFADSHNLPQIGELEQFIAARGMGRMRFHIGLGETMVAGSNTHIPAHKRRYVQGVLIGFSKRAMPIGMTVPIQYVERWNREFVSEEAASSYSSLIVTLSDKDEAAAFSAWLKSELQLELADSAAQQFATAIFIVTALFVLISLIIVTISAINISHNFFMQVSERRREIGLLRAVGATRWDVRLIILGEAAFIGVIGGVLGIAMAMAAGFAVDFASAELLPKFPYKPESYFDFTAPIVVGGLLFAVVFCVLGGYLPARKASLMEPAQALAQQ